MTLYVIGGIVLAVVGGLWLFGYRQRKAGEDSVRAETAIETVDVMKRQDKAAAEAPKTKDALVDRLQKGGF